MNEYKYDYSKINPENFTQKDLMQYLLHSTQHSATREELQEAKSELKEDIGEAKEEINSARIELKEEINNVRIELKEEINNVRIELKEEIKDVRTEIKDVRTEIKDVRVELKEDISKLDGKFDKKFDRMQWFLVAGFLGILFKDYIIKIFQ